MRRTAILIGERDEQIGRTVVTEAVSIIQHKDDLFVRTDKGMRLPGGGIGVIFMLTDPAIRNRLERP